MSRRTEQKLQTRRALLDAALSLSAEKGFSSLSLRAVAKEAGIAPTTFYRHFQDMEDLGLALVDEVGTSLRQLVRRARQRVAESGQGSVIRPSIQTFMSFAQEHANLFRLLLGEGVVGPPAFREAVAKEVERFTSDLVDDLVREGQAAGRPIAEPRLAAEAMVTVAFNLGTRALDLPPDEQRRTFERITQEVLIIMRGAEALAAGWEPGG